MAETIQSPTTPETDLKSSPKGNTKTGVLRGYCKGLTRLKVAVATSLLSVAGLGSGNAEAMDTNTRNILFGAVASVAQQETIRRQQEAQQAAQRARIQQEQLMQQNIQAIFATPTRFSVQSAIPELEKRGIEYLATHSTFSLFHRDTKNTPDFFNKQFEITSTLDTKVTNVTVMPMADTGAFVIYIQYVKVVSTPQGGQNVARLVQGSEEIKVFFDKDTKTFIKR